MADSETGFVYVAEISGYADATNISIDATSTDELCVATWGIFANGTIIRTINAGYLTGSNGTFACECPYAGCERWKLYIWKRNTVLSDNDISWTNGDVIPVASIINELNAQRQRFEDMTTNVARSLRAPELGSDNMLIPPAEIRAGKLLGFDDNGNPTTSDDCEMIALFDKYQAQLDALVSDVAEKFSASLATAQASAAEEISAASASTISELQTFAAQQQSELAASAEKASVSKKDLQQIALDAARSARQAQKAELGEDKKTLLNRVKSLELEVASLKDQLRKKKNK